MRKKLKEKISESLTSVLPVTVIVLILSFTLTPMPNGTMLLFLLGAAMLILGMGFFSLGADMAMVPIGEQMGVGGDDSWGANVHPEYIPDVTKPVEFTFTFRGI